MRKLTEEERLQRIADLPARRKLFRGINREKIKERKRLYYLKYKERIKQEMREKYLVNREKIAARDKIYREKNKEKIKIRSRNYQRNKYQNNIEFKIYNILRRRVMLSVKNQNTDKKGNTAKLIGCSVPEFKTYLSKLFKKGMTWENHGFRTWHIDHIRPCCSFDLSKEEDQMKCFHYTNLQPLWWHENLSKNGKYNSENIIDESPNL